MKITCWGCRGSLPTPGASTVEFGGNTTCFQIDGSQGELIVVDAGSGIRPLGNFLVKKDPRVELTLLLTHAHWDHLMGFPFFVPAYLPKYKIDVYGRFKTEAKLKEVVTHQFKAPYFPVKFRQLRAKIAFKELPAKAVKVGGISIDAIPLNHPGGGMGYRFREKGKTLVVLTDNELGYQHAEGPALSRYVQFVKGADLLLHDAQYTDEEYERINKSWGHSTFQQAFELAEAAETKRLAFCHHDQERTDSALRDIEQRYAKMDRRLKVVALREGKTLTV